MEKQETPFEIVFLKLDEVLVEMQQEQGGDDFGISLSELDAVNELRRLSLELAQPQVVLYSAS